MKIEDILTEKAANFSDAFDAVEEKGGTVSVRKSDNLAAAVETISTAGTPWDKSYHFEE